jgi:hypothetical protein
MYQIFNTALESDMLLPELPEVETSETVIKFSAGLDKKGSLNDPDWFFHWESPGGSVYTSCAKCEDGYILRFPNLVDFIISYTFDHIYYFAESTTPDDTIRHLLLDHVIPRILGQQGKLVLHASAVILPNGKAIAFLGNSGWGKSTIASSFHNMGARLITDDCLLIEPNNGTVVGIPNYYGLRLFNDSARAIFSSEKKFSRMAHYTEKKRLIMHKKETEEIPSKVNMDAFFFLNDPDIFNDINSVEIKPVQDIEIFMKLVEKMFILDVTETKNITQQFQNKGKIINSDIDAFELHYPRKHSILETVQTRISNLFQFAT